jgi:hypothetical protein
MHAALIDILPSVLAYLYDDYHTLSICSQVSRTFSSNTAHFLYAKVVYCPTTSLRAVLNLRRDEDEFTVNKVTRLDVSGTDPNLAIKCL